MNLRCVFLLMVSALAASSTFAYNRDQVTLWLQEQSYNELIAYAQNMPPAERDLYLLNAAGYAAYQNSLFDIGAAYFSLAVAMDSANIQAILYLGLIAKQKSCMDALPYFLTLTRLKPNNARYHRYAADCFAEMKQLDSAFRYTYLAYQIAPTDPLIANTYASSLLEKKKFQQADSVLEKALAPMPNNVALLTTSIRSAYLQKHYKQVLPLGDAVVLAGTISYVPLYYSLLAAFQLKDYLRCIHYYELLQAAGHETEAVQFYTAKAYAGLKKYRESNKLLQQCIQSAVSENAATYYTEMGENLVAMKQYIGAQHYYDTARYFTGDGMLLYRKALAYDAAKQDRQAKKTFQDFLKHPGTKDTAVLKYAASRIGAAK